MYIHCVSSSTHHRLQQLYCRVQTLLRKMFPVRRVAAQLSRQDTCNASSQYMSAVFRHQDHQPGTLPIAAEHARCRPICLGLPRPVSLQSLNQPQFGDTISPVQQQLSGQQGSGHSSSIQSIEYINKKSSVGPREQLQVQGQSICTCCKGAGSSTCLPCNGTGVLTRAGYNKRNPIPKEVINSKWTAMYETLGWRHFRVIQQRKKSGGLTFMLLQASCDPSAQLWVNKEALRDRSRWAAGWLLMSEMPNRTVDKDNEQGSMQDSQGTQQQDTDDLGKPDTEVNQQSRKGNATGQPQAQQKESKGGVKHCRACSGSGKVVCKQCDAAGIMLINL